MKFSKSQQRTIVLELAYSIFMILVGTVLPILSDRNNPDASQYSLYGMEIIAALGLSLQFYTYLTKSSRRILRIYLIAALISLPILFFAGA